MLKGTNITKKFGGLTALSKVNFEVNQGEIVGLLGRNGAGKTTSFRMTIGMISPDNGTVIFDGINVTKMPMHKRARNGMGYLSQAPSVFQRLSVADNVMAVLETMHLTRTERRARLESLMARLGLTHLGHSREELLGAQQQIVEVDRCRI